MSTDTATISLKNRHDAAHRAAKAFAMQAPKITEGAAAVLTALASLHDAERDLFGRTLDLVTVATRVRRNLSDGATVNSLGELQRDADHFDRLCAVIAERRNTVRLVAVAAGASPETVAAILA